MRFHTGKSERESTQSHSADPNEEASYGTEKPRCVKASGAFE
jgi:hypothetical protein